MYKEKVFSRRWYYIETNGIFERELYKEVGINHELFGKGLIAIARRKDRDDVLFCFEDNPLYLAQVHLTWKGYQEIEPCWPSTKIYNSWEEWATVCMLPDNED
jgi:hypothetical protein